MQGDPVTILGVHPTGAVASQPDPRDYPYGPEIAAATAPFDWAVGYDVEKDIGMTLTVKNQGDSGSCGGQAFSAYGQALEKAFNIGQISPRSAKFLYSQVYAPGGGSDFRSLAKIAQGQGFGLESDTPSYLPGGVVPTEAFMERPQDITGIARINAAKDKITLAYAFPTFDIDTVAQAIQANKGAVLGLIGTNNGTWVSTFPKPPSYEAPGLTNMQWSHYVYAGKAEMINGVKGIWILNSWGVNVGNGGWQWLSADYFADPNAIWSCTVLVYNQTPTARPTHSFTSNLTLGMQNADVLALQQILAYDGELNVAPTGYYGPITAQAVLKYQIKNVVSDPTTLAELGGDSVGPATRAVLNAQYGT